MDRAIFRTENPTEMESISAYDHKEKLMVHWFRHPDGQVTIMFSSPSAVEQVVSYRLDPDGTWTN